MLSRAHRLSGAGFTRAVRAGRAARTRTVVVHLDRGTGGGQAQDLAEPLGVRGGRAGVTVSKAVGNAVVRNRVKRRLRHLLAERISAFPRSSALVVRALPAAGTATFQTLARDLDAALSRLRAEAALGSVTR